MPYCSLGDYYVVVITDHTNRLNEGNSGELNNAAVSSTRLSLVSGNLARLNVTSITAPPTATAGQPVTVEWTVRNAGATVANASWLDYVYLSAANTLDPSTALFLGGLPRNINVQPGLSYSQSLTAMVPECASGPLYVYVVTDVTNKINAAACETNNTLRSSATVSVTPVAHPALQIFSVQTPDIMPSGAAVTVSYVVTNAGTAAAVGTWVDSIYLATKANDPGMLMELGRFTNSGPINAAATYARSVLVTMPWCSTGRFTSACSSMRGPNRFRQCAEQTTWCAPAELRLAYPDLQVSAVSKPPSVVGGVPFNMSWSVANSGALPLSGTWSDVAYLSPTPNLQAATAIPIGTKRVFRALQPGAS